MKSKIWISFLLISCILVSLYLRIVLPYDNVFTTEWIKFTSVDAYWQMDYVDRVAPFFNEYIFKVLEVPLFVWLISGVSYILGLGSPGQQLINTIGVYFPPIMAALTIIPVFFIGQALFSKSTGVFAGMFIAILPGEWLGRSILGFTDHHVAAVLFSTTMMMFLILAIKNFQKRRIVFGSLAVLFAALLYLTEGSALYFGTIFIATLICAALSDGIRRIMNTKLLVMFAVFGLLSFVFVFAKLDSLSHQISGFAMGNTAITTMEMQPILFPGGSFTPMVVWGTFGFIVLLFPLMFGLLIFKAFKSGNYTLILLVVWSVAMLVLMLEYRRFAYYFAVNASLITGWFIWYVRNRFNKNYYFVGVFVSTFLLTMTVIPNFQQSVHSAKVNTFAPSDAWYETFEWLKENTAEDSLIISWWDYGYWIKREAKRDVYVNPSQAPSPIKSVADMLLDGEIVEGDYLILDYSLTTGKLWAIATWAGKNPADYKGYYVIVNGKNKKTVWLFYPEYYESLSVRLYNFDGRAVTPTQSAVVTVDAQVPPVIKTMNVYATYEEARMDGGMLVGTHAFISPIPLQSVKGFKLVYESMQGINGVSEIKVFRYVK